MASTLPGTKSTTEPVGANHPLIDEEIVKAARDQRVYRQVFIANGLKCLLIADPCSEKDAVSLNLPMGYFCDPKGFEGLTNLLRGCIFAGHEYEDFVDFVCQNDGSVKSDTLSERSYFAFEVNSNVFSECLSRFAKLFVCPVKLNIRNLDADHSETLDDASILNKMQKFFTSTTHPYHKSSQGNMTITKKPGFEDELKKLCDNSISANLMTLVVSVKDKNFDEVKDMIEDNFAGIRNSELRPFSFSGSPCSCESLQILVKVLSMNGHSIRVQWPLIHNIDNSEEFGACQYLKFLFSYKEEGSLFYALNDRGWCTSVHGSEHDRNSKFSFFSVNVELTDTGKTHFEDICGLIFNYIQMLKKAGPRKYIFEKMQSVSEEQRQVGLNGSVINYVDKIASNLLVFPVKDCLTGGTYPLVYSKTIIRKVLSLFTPENARLFWVSNTFEELAHSEYKLDGLSYYTEPLSTSCIKEWKNNTSDVNLDVPTQDDLIPSASLKERVQNKASISDQRPGILYSPKDESNHVSQDLASISDQHPGILYSPKDESNHVSQDLGERKVCIIFDERMVKMHVPPLPEKPTDKPHVENPARIRSIPKKFQEDGLFDRCAVYDSERAKYKHLIQVHNDDHITRIVQNKLHDRNVGNKDMYMSRDSSDAIFLAAGGAVKACQMVATGKHTHAFAVVRPPGHHANAEMESGFCFFNNIAIATKSLLTDHEVKPEIKKVLIIDWDIHFGDGTSKIFEHDKQVLFISIHRHPYDFPTGNSGSINNIGKGDATGYNCNFCWSEKGARDDDLYAVFDHLVMPLATEFDPDIVLISGGFDAALNDRVGDCSLSPSGFATALQKLLILKKGIVIVLEGGYTPDIVADCCSSCVKILCGESSPIVQTGEYFPREGTWHTILKLRLKLSEYWNNLKSEIPPEFLERTWKEPPAEVVVAPRKPRYPKRSKAKR